LIAAPRRPTVNSKRRPSPGVAAALALFFVTPSACAPGPPGEAEDAAADAAPPAEVVIQGFETLISDATTDLSMPVGLEVDADGNVWIVDRRLSRVLMVAPEGAPLRTIGRNGEGPGEFRLPANIGIRGDRALVHDNFHNVQAFDMAGDYLLARPTDGRIFSSFDFTGDGGSVYSDNRVNAGGALVAVEGPGGEPIATLGELPFSEARSWDFPALRDQLLEGTIPPELRNTALPIAAPDGSLWVLLQTEATLRRYAPDGSLLAETIFELPELEGMKQQYFEDFRTAPGSDVFIFPSMADDGFATGESLLLLWGTVAGEPGLITVHDASGALSQRWVFPELDSGGGGMVSLRLALDVPRRRLYVSVSDIATVFAVDLPEEVTF
jgi:hypothetical protein